MSSSEKKTVDRSTRFAYGSIGIALLLVILLGVWGAYRDISLVHTTLLNAEISKLRAQAVRRVGHIEVGLEQQYADKLTDWSTASENQWLQRYWQGVQVGGRGKLYASVVDLDGRVVLHSDRRAVGEKLGERWYRRAVPAVGDDVVETSGNVLDRGQPAYDIRIPVMIGQRTFGNYHEGISVTWVDEQAAGLRGRIMRRWFIVIGGVAAIVGVSCVSLYYIISRKAEYLRRVDLADMRRVTEIGQLAAGLVHEIRNPLHTIRLNLHTFGKSRNGNTSLSDDDITAMIQQSQKEIDRVEHLMSELLSFATPREPRNERINLNRELRELLDFIEQELVHKKVTVTTDFSPIPLRVEMDSGRLRQIVLNLLMNAQDALDEGGKINVGLRQAGHEAEIVVRDDGPGIDEEDQKRIFEPFFSTKGDGSGLGLALVKRFVDEADGEITCESNGHHGTKFTITLPLARRQAKELV